MCNRGRRPDLDLCVLRIRPTSDPLFLSRPSFLSSIRARARARAPENANPFVILEG